MSVGAKEWLKQLPFETGLVLASFILGAAGAMIGVLAGYNPLYGASLGVFAPSIILIVLVIVLGGLSGYPVCRCGRCKGNDYTFIEIEPKGVVTEDTEFHYKCSFCARRWAEKGSVFYEVTPDGLKPYKKRFSTNIWWWVDASGEQ